jgi:hypothetical protein
VENRGYLLKLSVRARFEVAVGDKTLSRENLHKAGLINGEVLMGSSLSRLTFLNL